MSGSDVVRAWTGTRFEPVEEPVGATLAADSWLVVDGAVLAFDRHRRRFADAVADVGGDADAALAAADAAATVVPAGTWSPRLDLTPEGIRLRIRPAPAPSATVEVVTAARDPRTLPLRKGPDLEALAALQAEERARIGADVEPILTEKDPRGDGARRLVAEGTWSALLWWDGDALVVPAADILRLPSVTAAVILDLARADGIEVREARATPDDLEGREVWLANALRGIRAVTRWHGGPRVATPERAPAWRSRLESLRRAPAADRTTDGPIASRR
ncbi:aminotransferase class IV [Agrococcus sp. DT81.2]|uniref:aminotransferase class IV n=1 Tax=Agrococcus sp. DT81.2 TaxID=3393414 RepID=UPI003CE4B7AB